MSTQCLYSTSFTYGIKERNVEVQSLHELGIQKSRDESSWFSWEMIKLWAPVHPSTMYTVQWSSKWALVMEIKPTLNWRKSTFLSHGIWINLPKLLSWLQIFIWGLEIFAYTKLLWKQYVIKLRSFLGHLDFRASRNSKSLLKWTNWPWFETGAFE